MKRSIPERRRYVLADFDLQWFLFSYEPGGGLCLVSDVTKALKFAALSDADAMDTKASKGFHTVYFDGQTDPIKLAPRLFPCVIETMHTVTNKIRRLG